MTRVTTMKKQLPQQPVDEATERLAGSGTSIGTALPSESPPRNFGQEFWTRFRVMVFAGLVVGVPVIGLGSRLVMFVLRLTSPESVVGATSDDGFTIGDFTLGGTYNLMMMGMGLGVLGAAAYLVVKPLLFGPSWFRRVATGIGAGLVVAPIVINADGADFVILEPTWLAIGLFVALPIVFGIAIGPVVDLIADRESATTARSRSWILPIVALTAFPLSWFVVVWVAAGLAVCLALRGTSLARGIRTPAGHLVGQVVIVAIAGLGLSALLNDINAIV